MNQEPVLIKGVVAFPNPNGNREIRFIDAFYHDLFKIPDHSNIVISYLDGGKRCVPCEYIDDTHVDIDGTAFHICQFAELMMRNGATYEPEHPPAEPTYGTYEIYCHQFRFFCGRAEIPLQPRELLQRGARHLG